MKYATKNSIVFPFAAYVGTVFGVGLYSLPYVMSQSGLWIFLFFLLLVASLVFLVNFLFADVVLRTPSKERFLGYVRQYIGSRAATVFGWVTIVGFWGTFLAYLLVWGEFAFLAFGDFIPMSSISFSIIFFVLTLFAIIKGGRTVEWIDVIMLSGAAVLFVVLFVTGSDSLTHVLTSPQHAVGYVLPYGTLMFAFWGAGIIPEIVNQMRERPTQIKKLLIFGKIVPITVGLFFALFVVGLTGAETSKEAFSALEPFIGRAGVVVGALIGLITISLSYNNLGWVSRNILMYDAGFPKWKAITAVVAPPAVLMLLGLTNFVLVISVIGAVFLASQGLMIFWLYRRSHTKESRGPSMTKRPIPPSIISIASALFLIGVVVELGFIVYELLVGAT